MTYGAKESNSKEGLGLLLLVTGMCIASAGWAYGPGLLAPLLAIVGLAVIGGSFAVLKMAKEEG